MARSAAGLLIASQHVPCVCRPASNGAHRVVTSLACHIFLLFALSMPGEPRVVSSPDVSGSGAGADSLKYHLLGPSLTKAGQDAVDQAKVSEVIYAASKGSKFFENEAAKDRTLSKKIDRLVSLKKELDHRDLGSTLRRADDYITELERSRDLSQIIVHIDCDAFYAAVEELDRPDLKHVPMAVGQGVLTTCNYHGS